MTEPASRKSAPALTRDIQPLAGFLSLLIPGAGQIYQRRISKGLLFFFCIYLLFFYGMYLGKGQNVYIPATSRADNPWDLGPPLGDLWNRPQYIAQFWVGVVAWPAIYQRITYNPSKEKGPVFGRFEREPFESEERWRDADFKRGRNDKPKYPTINQLQQESDKLWDLGWVLTVIAGALNVMVIYDAAAGPAFPPEARNKDESDEESKS